MKINNTYSHPTWSAGPRFWFRYVGFRAVFVLLASPAVLYACPPELPPQKVDRIVYQVQDGRLLRINQTNKTRQLLPEPSDVTAVAHSYINCTFDPDRKPQWETEAEPVLLAILKKDGTVWVRGRVWKFWGGRSTRVLYDTPTGKCPSGGCRLKTPPLLFDSPVKFIQIQAVRYFGNMDDPGQVSPLTNVVQIVAGEMLVAARDKDHHALTWGRQTNASVFGRRENGDDRVQLMPYADHVFEGNSFTGCIPRDIFKPGQDRKLICEYWVRNLMAFHYMVYGLELDGRLNAMGPNDALASVWDPKRWVGIAIPPEVDRQRQDPQKRAPIGWSWPVIFDSDRRPVMRIWQTDGNLSECNAEFIDGERWTWPCYDYYKVIIPRDVRRSRATQN